MFDLIFAHDMIMIPLMAGTGFLIGLIFSILGIVKNKDKKGSIIAAGVLIPALVVCYFALGVHDMVTKGASSESISEEDAHKYTINKSLVVEEIEANYNVSYVDLEKGIGSVEYSNRESAYLIDGNARFDGQVIDFSVSINLDGEIEELALYSTDYSEEDLLISQ